ncbi:helix-turn-helix transcriptional regulator [Actinoplanes rectilineatus]|uniref:helix-turn-helix transcriptional regulator n=1 Tax=Actinoplanes rectilineatus TaxID=113571 RepID=UPI0005F294ED|nr:helix-turn-helix transcriptional regulator [Actinoplanes rectilineatus]
MIRIRTKLDAQLVHRALRTASGLTPAQLAERLRISQNTVHTREAGRSGFSIEALADLGELFGFDLVLVPRRDADQGCCEHCRRAAAVVEERRDWRARSQLGGAWNALYDGIAAALGRRA